MAEEKTNWSAVTRRGSLALGLGAIAAAATRGAPPPAAHRNWSTLEAMAERAVRDRSTPGMQLSVMERGALIFSKGFGLANLETATPVTPASVFRFGSLIKQFDAAAILLLQEEGRLSVDDRLSRHIPEVPHAGEVTLRQMLTHTSGLGATAVGPQEAAYARLIEHDSASLLAVLLGRNPRLMQPPGTQWVYNNFAFKLLGIIIERVSGQPWPQFLRRRLFEPLALRHAAIDRTDEVVAGRASGYQGAPGAPSGFRNADFTSMGWTGAAGSLRSTTEDLCRWHTALLGGAVLRPASLEAMLTPARLNDGTLPTSPSGPRGDGPLETVRYGFGLNIDMEGERRLVTHTGAIEGFTARLSSYPDQRLTVAGVVNAQRYVSDRPGPGEPALTAAIQEAARIALS